MRKIVSALLVPLILCTVAIFPVKVQASGLEAKDIVSESAILIDAESGQILFQKNMNQKTYPASITKVMTGMLALEKGSLSQILTMSDEAVFSIDRTSSHIALDVDEEINLEQALFALAIASANEAANGIAESVSGTIDGFVDQMNQKALEVGANNTNFINTNGLHEKDHYTTAYDMAKITAAALKNPKFIEIFGAERYEIPPTNKQPETRTMWNRNKFLNGGFPYEGILMSKTGWTREAQHTLISAAQRGDRTLVAVVLKTPYTMDMYKDTSALFDYGFDAFIPVTINKADLIKATPSQISISEDSTVDASFGLSNDVSLLIPVGKTIDDLRITYGEAEIDQDQKEAKLIASIRLADSDSVDPLTGFMGLDVSLTSQLEPSKDNIAKASGFLQASSGKIFLGSMILLSALTAFFLFTERIKNKKRMQERRARERRARERQAMQRQQMQTNRYHF